MAQYDEPEKIISDSLRFKEKLGIGEEAYRVLKIGKNLETVAGGRRCYCWWRVRCL